MKKSKQTTQTTEANSATQNLGVLVDQVRALVQTGRQTAVSRINSLLVRTNFEIGRLIVEHEQQGLSRAQYGKHVLTELSGHLTSEFGGGFSRSNLQSMRTFFLLYQDGFPTIRQNASGKSMADQIRQTASGELTVDVAKPSDKWILSSDLSTLSWSHYILLIGIKDENERRFYEIEAARNAWSILEFKRQIGSGLYERLALSRDKASIKQLARDGHTITQPADLLKDPYVLEFLGLEEKPAYSESDLEKAIIGKLQHFLLELGKGFLFEARQKRFSFDEDHFYVDLVFYNRLLHCYVLIDLKLDQLTHQDLGQMQMYVNYFDRFIKTPEENPTIGILLCKRKKDALIELTLPKNANIFASAYQLYLPSKEELRERLLEWTRSDTEIDNNSPTNPDQ